jgi:large subunit ribosomal protein L22
MEVTAKLRFLRMSPRKVRLVTDLIRGKTVQDADAQLSFLPKRAARPVYKLLHSAVANAENNFKLKKENLFINRIMVDMGPSLKRWRPRAFGRAAPIVKKSSHITIILSEVKPTVKKGKKTLKTTEAKADQKKPATAKETKRPVVDFKDIKRDSKGKPDATSEEQQKKPLVNFKNIKEKFTRRLGEK